MDWRIQENGLDISEHIAVCTLRLSSDTQLSPEKPI